MGRSRGIRTLVGVPMLKDNELVGAIVIYRKRSVRLPTSRSSWWNNFAAQAVIAIENARLLSELARIAAAADRDCGCSPVISCRSPGNLEPVFDAILANATQICRCTVWHFEPLEGDALRRVALPMLHPNMRCGAVKHFDPIRRAPEVVCSRTNSAHIEDIRTA